jgi:hypothetical protein
MPVNWAPNFTIFFFIGNKRNSIKKACKGAPKHTWSIQKGHQNKRKTGKKKKRKKKRKGRTPEKTQKTEEMLHYTPNLLPLTRLYKWCRYISIVYLVSNEIIISLNMLGHFKKNWVRRNM